MGALPTTYSISSYVSSTHTSSHNEEDNGTMIVQNEFIDLKDLSTETYEQLTMKNRDNAIKAYVQCGDKHKGTQVLIDLYLQRWRQEERDNIPQTDACFVGIDKVQTTANRCSETLCKRNGSKKRKCCKSKRCKKKMKKKKKKKLIMIKPQMVNHAYDRRFSFDFGEMNGLDLNDSVDDVVEIESESSYYPQNPFDSLSLSLSLTPDMENGIIVFRNRERVWLRSH